MGRNAEWMNSALVGRDGFCRTPFAPALFMQDYHGWFDHFVLTTITSTTTMAGFVLTGITTGTVVAQDMAGGVLGLVGGSADGKGIEIQAAGECFLPAANKDLFLEARVACVDADDIDWFIGLATTDTSLFASEPDNKIEFSGDDGDANLDFQVRGGGAGDPVDTTYDMANNTWRRVGFHVKGVTSVTPYIDGVAGTAVTANIPAVEMKLSFGMLDGATAAPNKLLIDWIRVMQFGQAA